MTLARTNHDAIDRWERKMMGYPKRETKTVHRFAGGIHGRELTVPDDTFITGRCHRTEHLFVMSKGKVRVLRNGVAETLVAPYAGINPCGYEGMAVTDLRTLCGIEDLAQFRADFTPRLLARLAPDY